METPEKSSALRRPVLFLLVGIANTVLDFLFYTFLVLVFFQGNDEIWLVGLISGTFAIACAYTTHKLITWRDRPATRTTILKFFFATGLGLWVIRPALLTIFIGWNFLYAPVHQFVSTTLGVPLSYEFVASTGAFAFMVVIVMAYNYIMYSRFVFTGRDGIDQETR